MQKRILIIDDHDDLRSGLADVFERTGYHVVTKEDRLDALSIKDFTDFALVIVDLDDCQKISIDDIPDDSSGGDTIKAFKISAASFVQEGQFNEEELAHLFETVLNFKAQYVDKKEIVQDIREKIEFAFPSTIKLMHPILNYLMRRVEKIGVAAAEDSHLFIALDEAFVNAVKHGNKFDIGKLVKVSADISTREARFTVEDQGEGFDVHSIPDPLDPENLFKASGRGVLIIHNVMDEVTYNDRGNRITMVKKSTHIDEKSG